MPQPGRLDSALMTLVRAIVAGDAPAASRLLAASPELARARFAVGATRQGARAYYLEIAHHLYAGDTAPRRGGSLPSRDARQLIYHGRRRPRAMPRRRAAARRRRRHPGLAGVNPRPQQPSPVSSAGADEYHRQRRVAPLHRAVRTRCAAAVRPCSGADATGTRTARRRCLRDPKYRPRRQRIAGGESTAAGDRAARAARAPRTTSTHRGHSVSFTTPASPPDDFPSLPPCWRQAYSELPSRGSSRILG